MLTVSDLTIYSKNCKIIAKLIRLLHCHKKKKKKSFLQVKITMNYYIISGETVDKQSK